MNATNWNQSHIIGSGAIQSGALGASMVNSGNVSANAIISGNVASGAVTYGALASGAISSGGLAANAVTSGNIATLSVTSGAIASGATSWNLFGPSKPFVTVTPNGPTDGGDYGPNTSGTTTAGIQEAINALLSGGTVSIRGTSATYKTSGLITLKSNTNLIGESINTTIKRQNAGSVILVPDGAVNFSIMNFTLDNTLASASGGPTLSLSTPAGTQGTSDSKLDWLVLNQADTANPALYTNGASEPNWGSIECSNVSGQMGFFDNTFSPFGEGNGVIKRLSNHTPTPGSFTGMWQFHKISHLHIDYLSVGINIFVSGEVALYFDRCANIDIANIDCEGDFQFLKTINGTDNLSLGYATGYWATTSGSQASALFQPDINGVGGANIFIGGFCQVIGAFSGVIFQDSTTSWRSTGGTGNGFLPNFYWNAPNSGVVLYKGGNSFQYSLSPTLIGPISQQPISATVYQNLYGVGARMYVSVTAASGATSSVSVAIGGDNTTSQPIITGKQITSGLRDIVIFDVPAGFFWAITGSGVTINADLVGLPTWSAM